MRLVSILILTVALLTFQNCGKPSVNFDKANGNVTKIGDVAGTGNSDLPEVPADPPKPPSDPNPPPQPPQPPVPPPGPGPDSVAGICDPSDVAQIKVNVDKAVLYGVGGVVVELNSVAKNVDLLQGFIISLNSSISVQSIRLVTSPSGNVLVNNNGAEKNIKIPSGPFSGFKIFVDPNPAKLLANKNYLVKVEQADLKLISTGNGKCLLRPVAHITLVP